MYKLYNILTEARDDEKPKITSSLEKKTGGKKDDATVTKELSQKFPQWDFSNVTYYFKNGERYLNGLYCPKKDFFTGQAHGITNNINVASLKSRGSGCRKCGEEKLGYNIPKEIEYFKEKKGYILNPQDFYYEGEGKEKKLFVKNITCTKHDPPIVFYTDKGVSLNNLKRDKGGCPVCGADKRESLGEKKVYDGLKKLGYTDITTQKQFPGAGGCFSYKGQKSCNLLRFDAYIVKDGEKICIEFDGEQHYKPFKFFGGEDGLKARQENDRAKTEWCENNGVRLIRIPYSDYNNIDKILKKEVGYNDTTKQPIAEAQRLKKLAGITEIKIRPKGMGSKYIQIEKDSNGDIFPYFDNEAIEKYLKSVIDPEYINEVDYFMDDEDIGWGISSVNYFIGGDDGDDFEISNFLKITDEEVENYAEQEMSYFLFSRPDEFPYKD